MNSKIDRKFLASKNMIIDFMIEHVEDFPTEAHLLDGENLEKEIIIWKAFIDGLIETLKIIRDVERNHIKL